ncbi:dTDP-4-dehydrorhamnose 3,5-epimerase family protein [Amycolatopsis rubida]|uniref:Epimerase EvaD n=1 Tax=Amycolatopsis rubida TaxID=112413 RepID=A0A1I5TKS5_9PSEU|nr:dTDP-4-dehydrorhamnose 3,5-epimerase family protein [Amycolatopsis rubida]SFP83672.1 epimerase EvaD [Amycolatopsis rubida]
MKVRPLAVRGAFEFRAEVFPDDRGRFCTPYEAQAFHDDVGRLPFPVARTSFSTSRKGVVRGVHYSRAATAGEKYVFCPGGACLDLVVDVRVGSPTYGRWDCVTLGPDTGRALYLPKGVGHGFVALRDETVMCYQMSNAYVPEDELAVSVLDAELGLPIPSGIEPVLSERDRAATSLAAARSAGLLPGYEPVASAASSSSQNCLAQRR